MQGETQVGLLRRSNGDEDPWRRTGAHFAPEVGHASPERTDRRHYDEVGSPDAASGGVLRDCGGGRGHIGVLLPRRDRAHLRQGAGRCPRGPDGFDRRTQLVTHCVGELWTRIALRCRGDDGADTHRRPDTDASGDLGVHVGAAVGRTAQSKRGADADHPPAGGCRHRVHRPEQPGIGVQPCWSGRRGAIQDYSARLPGSRLHLPEHRRWIRRRSPVARGWGSHLDRVQLRPGRDVAL